jgi:hypothetical protein
MKFDELKSIAHNLSHSFGSGISMLAGEHDYDVYEEAARSKDGFITVDFLKGQTIAGAPTERLAVIISRFPAALRLLCERHNCEPGEFTKLVTRYGTDPVHGCHFTVTVENAKGRAATDRYFGWDGLKGRSQ